MNDYLNKLRNISEGLAEVKAENFRYFKENVSRIPSRTGVADIIAGLQYLMFPKFFPGKEGSDIYSVYGVLREQIERAYSFLSGAVEHDSSALALEILSEIPRVKEKLLKDAIAIYEGDPAATSPEEVMLCYPGFLAISIYRLAHEFYLREVPFISRMMTELAHEKTGVDIHAGATIGEYFCIDHGTGIVIGETAVIGDRVKIYQGVTLGAKSFQLSEDGNPIKGIKRHPNIGRGVVIYANATILGGDTYIGDGAVIGANVWLTSSVEAGQVVHYNKKN